MSCRSQEPTRTADDWQRRYQAADTPWDSGLVDPELRRIIESHEVPPGRAVEFGCGTGTNAVFLAQQGFAVTGIDYSLLAIERAGQKAAAAGVAAQWHIGDLAALDPSLGPFDFLFDRGCYHCVRRAGQLSNYLATVERLLRPGARLLVLAGNSDSVQEGGPPKVSAVELCGDFQRLCSIQRLVAYHFEDAVDVAGPLAWSLTMTRR